MAVSGLTEALQATIQDAVPLSKPCPHSKCWWSSRLSEMKRKKKNKLSSLAYPYRALADHPVHEEHRQIWNSYSDEIRKAKQAHGDSFLMYALAPDVWVTNWYILGPGRDSGKSRIPMLLLGQPGRPPGSCLEAATNKEKSKAFIKSMFPGKPASCLVPTDYSYPALLPLRGSISEGQVCHHLTKLSPHKATGTDRIPNTVLKECADALVPYLVHIFWAMFMLQVYYGQWKEIVTCVLGKPGKPHYGVPKAYRPIMLLNSLAKLATSIVAEELSYMVETHGLLLVSVPDFLSQLESECEKEPISG